MTLQRENLTLQRKTVSQENKKENSESRFLIISAFTELARPPYAAIEAQITQQQKCFFSQVVIRQPRNINHLFLTVHLCFIGNSALPFYFYISKLHQTPKTNFKEHIQ